MTAALLGRPIRSACPARVAQGPSALALVQDKAQDAANSARFQMDQKNNEFNNAVLHLEDTIQLCNTPQPPPGCDHTLEEAQANVKCKSTLASPPARCAALGL